VEASVSKSITKGADELTPIKELMTLLIKTAEENCKLDNKISLKELSHKNSLYAEPGEGFTEARYYDNSTVKIIPVLFLCRSDEQERCFEQLESICNYFERLQEYPQGKNFAWLNTETAKEPYKIGRDEGGAYHYSCILNCKIFY